MSLREFNTALEKLFSLTPPTALILADVAHVPRVVSFLLSKGLRYPDDVSILVLDAASELQEYEPPISYIKKSNVALAKITLTAARKMMTLKQEPDQVLTVVPTKLVVTGSIAEVMKK